MSKKRLRKRTNFDELRGFRLGQLLVRPYVYLYLVCKSSHYCHITTLNLSRKWFLHHNRGNLFSTTFDVALMDVLLLETQDTATGITVRLGLHFKK